MTALTPPPLARHDSARGIAFLCAGLSVFAVQDLILKLLSGDYPLHQAMVMRSLTAAPLLLMLVHLDGGLKTLFTPGWPRMVTRGLIMFVAYTAYYLALAALPMATTVALYFSAPLMITVLSVFMLREHVSLPRWLAVLAGFIGVIIMVRPGSDLFDWAALLPVISGLTYGLSMIQARTQGTTQTAAALAFHGNAVFLICALMLSAVFGTGAFASEQHKSLAFLLRGWATPTLFDLGLMMACGVIAAAGLTLLTQAYRIAQSNTVAPFEYTGMIWGVLYGWLIWSDWPDTTAWIGIAIIVGAGLFVLWREKVENRASPGLPA
ncbi:MAG: DMT family transporter [Paracoccaceae bacterium]